MAIQRFKQFVAEASATDYVAPKDSDGEAKGYTPRSKGEEDFANMHNVTKTDYAIAGQDHIFNGTIKEETEVEALDEEVELIEGKVFDALKKIVDTKQAGRVKFANGKSVKVDGYSASALVQLHGKLKPELQKKMEDDIEKAPERLMKLLDFAFSKAK